MSHPPLYLIASTSRNRSLFAVPPFYGCLQGITSPSTLSLLEAKGPKPAEAQGVNNAFAAFSVLQKVSKIQTLVQGKPHSMLVIEWGHVILRHIRIGVSASARRYQWVPGGAVGPKSQVCFCNFLVSSPIRRRFRRALFWPALILRDSSALPSGESLG